MSQETYGCINSISGESLIMRPSVGTSFDMVCKFCRSYDKSSAVKTDSPKAKEVLESLSTIKQWLEDGFEPLKRGELVAKVSQGNGYFPKVPWVVLLPSGQTVSNGVYLGMCFGREGAGAIIGCATSVTNETGLSTERRSLRNLSIDIDGDRETTLYNDAFANPLEVLYSKFDESVVKKHFDESLTICLAHLQRSPTPIFTPPVHSDQVPVRVRRALTNEDDSNSSGVLTPEDLLDKRRRITASMWLREGQPEFRKKVVDAYSGKCAITECSVLAVLEAAHIVRYSGANSNKQTNGLLLRADIHTLFDRGLIVIDDQLRIVVHPQLSNTPYQGLHGTPLRLPQNRRHHPDKDALRIHREQAGFSSAVLNNLS